MRNPRQRDHTPDGGELSALRARVGELEARPAALTRPDAELRDSRERFELAVAGSSDGLWDWDLRTDRVHYSSRFKELLGYGADEFDDDLDAWIDHLHGDDRDLVLAQLREHLEQDTPFRHEYRLRTKAGGYRWFVARGACLRDGAGAAVRMAGSITDITEQREAAAAVRRSQNTYRALFETIRDGIVITDLNGSIREANPAFLRMLGYGPDQTPEITYQSTTPPEWAAQDERSLRQCLQRGYSDTYEKEYLRRDGSRLPVEIRVWLADPEEDSPSGERELLAVVRDITERKIAEQRIRHLAFFDGLTGLPNRQLFQARLDEALEEATVSGESVAVLFIDLDRFKQVNDTLGHGAGDRLLSEVARRFSKVVRKNDLIARAGDERDELPIARLGGDEFTVVLHVKGAEDAAVVAERLLRVLRDPFVIESHEVFIGASIGIATFPDDAADAETLTRKADTAMYSAKERGRGIYQFYSESMNATGLRKLEMEMNMRRSLEEGGFEVHYQLQRNARDGRVSGCEALLRWTLPDGEPVSPIEFIPIAEESGLISPLGEWVLREACARSVAWARAGYASLPVSVNVSARQFRSDDFPNRLEAVLRETGIDASRVELEITESAFLTDERSIATAFRRIKDLGVRIALDDFGTGYSSLGYLRRFPIDRVKIDRSFVREISTNPNDRALIDSIIAMVHTLGMEVVAEGVESLEQAEILRACGCDALQGYLFARPVPPAAFERYLERAKAR